ncbi:MAG: hypothetical protein EOM67_08090 [Spirochaetia bacterium]|nr:hypothetical protein [Spirochaetia bacterium]
MKRTLLILITLTMLLPLSAFSFEPFVETEQGAIAILSHTYQNGPAPAGGTSTQFDFRNQGGQELLLPFSRYAVGATIAKNHRVWFTYQPLLVETNVTFRTDVKVGENVTGTGPMTFVAGTPMKLLYSFPFYRVSYTYDVLSKVDNAVLGLGVVVQLRNASIRFESLTGGENQLYVSQNLGVVPALAIYSEYSFPFGLTLSADIAGIYASSAFFNGADFEFEGSILDASLRASYDIGNGYSLFGVARFFGGTSNGVSQYDDDDVWTVSSYEYTQNNIATLTASVGLKWSK